MAWRENKAIIAVTRLYLDIWNDLRDLLRLMVSGLLARYVFKIATQLLGRVDENTFIHKVDIWGGNIVFLTFVVVGLITFVMKSYYGVKKYNLEQKEEYEQKKREISKYVASGIESLPGKAREAWHDAAEGLDDFDPEDEK